MKVSSDPLFCVLLSGRHWQKGMNFYAIAALLPLFFFSKQICKFLRALALVLLPRGGDSQTRAGDPPLGRTAVGGDGAAFQCRDIPAGPSAGTAKRRLWRPRDEEPGTGPALPGGQRLQRGVGESILPRPSCTPPAPGSSVPRTCGGSPPGPQVGEGGRRAGAQRGEPHTSPRRPRGCAAAVPAPLPRSERGGPLAAGDGAGERGNFG